MKYPSFIIKKNNFINQIFYEYKKNDRLAGKL